MSHRSRNLTRQIRANDQRRRARANIGETSPSGQGYPGPGATNAYRCATCDKFTVTIHRAAGVTPMFLACRATEGCDGRAISGMYRHPTGCCVPPPTQEWYRPDAAELAKMDPAMQEHIRAGGLALRPIT